MCRYLARNIVMQEEPIRQVFLPLATFSCWGGGVYLAVADLFGIYLHTYIVAPNPLRTTRTKAPE